MKVLTAAIALLMLAGCARQGGTYVTDAQVEGFQDGSATIDQVRSSLGAPLTDINDSSGIRTLGYSFTATNVSGTAFIPVVGVFAGSASSRVRTVIFQFDAQGILRKHTVLNSQYGPG